MSSTLGRRAYSDGTAPTIGQHVRNVAALAAQADPDGLSHVAALNDFAEYVGSRPSDDQRIYMLWRLMGAAGSVDVFEPGENVTTLLAVLGTTVKTPETRETLDEFVAAFLDDYLASLAPELSELRTAAQTLERELNEAQEAAERLKDELGDKAELEAELAQARERTAELEQHNTHLRAMNPGSPDSLPSEWRAVEGYPNIHEKMGRDGEIIYRVQWREDGGQRKKSTGPILAEAIAYRAQHVPAFKDEAVPA